MTEMMTPDGICTVCGNDGADLIVAQHMSPFVEDVEFWLCPACKGRLCHRLIGAPENHKIIVQWLRQQTRGRR